MIIIDSGKQEVTQWSRYSVQVGSREVVNDIKSI